MPKTEVLEEGDIIVYAGEGPGGDLTYPDEMTGEKLGWRFVAGEEVTVGTDIPLEYCQALVMQGICRVLRSVGGEAAMSPGMTAALSQDAGG